MTPGYTTFAIPGDLETLSGGYIYEKQLLLALRRIGWTVDHLRLPDGFPEPQPAQIADTAAALGALSPEHPVILDGFLTGAMPPDQLADLRAPFISVTHHPLAYETGLHPTRAAYLKQVERANLARAARIIVPSLHTAEMLIDDFDVRADKVTVAPPGVLRSSRSNMIAQAVPHILVVGQLVPRKGHDILLTALARLRDLNWTASIVGPATDADCAEALRVLSEQLGLADRVTFTGPLSPEALSRAYANATVFALATHYEGYGMVFAEAMVHGLPIITCSGGAVPDTVPDDAGILVPVGDADAFGAALRQVLESEGVRHSLASASASHGARLPSWDETARLVAEVLDRVARQP